MNARKLEYRAFPTKLADFYTKPESLIMKLGIKDMPNRIMKQISNGSRKAVCLQKDLRKHGRNN